MATIKFSGLDQYLANLSALEVATSTVVKDTVYVGAEIVADAVRQELEALPVGKGRGTQAKPLPGPIPRQKKGLLNSLGVTPMGEKDGQINVHIGFDGYNDLVTTQWPKGQPNPMVARAISSGTSFMEAHPFVKQALARCRGQARKKMKDTAEKAIEKIMKG